MPEYEVHSTQPILRSAHVTADSEAQAVVKYMTRDYVGATSQTIGEERVTEVRNITPKEVTVLAATGMELLDAALGAAAEAIVALDSDENVVLAQEHAYETAVAMLESIMDIDGRPARVALDEAIVKLRQENAR